MKFFPGKNSIDKKMLIEQIISENYNKYYRLAYRYVYNDEDASDIVQNTAYKAIKNSSSLKQPEYAQTWIYRILLNECFLFLKKQKCYSYDDIKESSSVELKYIEDHDANIDLQREIDSLPDRDKAIIILRYFEDKKLEEIAEILGESTNTVKSRLYRCLKRMREALSDEDGKNNYKFSNGIGGWKYDL